MVGKTGIAVRNIQRAPAAAVAQLAKFGVATIHEAMGRTGLLAPYLRPIYRGARVCGSAVTVLGHPGDNWMLHVAAELLQAGDVVVMGMTAPDDHAMFGELLGTSFRARGGAGLVVDAMCAGALVHAGDVIVGDDDGVVVVPAAQAAQVARASQEREDREAATRARLAKGELGLDIYDMRGKLSAAGLEYYEKPEDVK